MAEQQGEKKYDATPHRMQQARQQGQVAKSQDLTSVSLLFAGLAILLYIGQVGGQKLQDYTIGHLSQDAWVSADQMLIQNQAVKWAYLLGVLLLPMLGTLFLVAVVTNLLQTGFLFLPSKLSFDLKRLNPMQGAQRMVSLQNAVKLAFGIFKVIVVVAVAVYSLWNEGERLLAVTGLDVGQIAYYMSQVTLWTCFKIAAALLVLALLDYFFQRWKLSQDLRMTEEEMREEIKQTQGDPQIMARRRAVQRQLVMNRLNSSVPEADVVVTNPTELAVALKYDLDTMPAPVVVAKGAGVLAQRIRRLALESNIPIVERKELAQLLYRDVDVNRAVPSSAYAAVAEVLRYVYELKGKKLPTLDQRRAS